MTAQRVRIIFAACLLLLAMTDFTRRIWVPRHFEARAATSFVPATVAPPPATSRIRQDLATWLPKLRPVAEGSGPAADQDWSLTLLAVFDDRSARFAVIRATPAAGGSSVLKRVAEGDKLYGYEVARIAPLAVALTGQQGEQELRLFKPGSVGARGAGPAARESLPATIQPGAGGAPAAATAPSPQRMQGQLAGPVTAPAAPATVDMTKLKSGDPTQLPESMRGLKIVVTPPPPQKNGTPSSAKPAEQAPRKP
ncbi:MAG: hypothetical protein FIB04_06620 [Gammaproteobacteria bacterium]|nr:hypothetical protein [Gammaproteobacteria bacterium]